MNKLRIASICMTLIFFVFSAKTMHKNTKKDENKASEKLLRICMCEIEELDQLKSLVENENADVNVVNYSGNSPLHIAAVEGHKNIIAYLLSRGADIRQKNKNKLTPLDLRIQILEATGQPIDKDNIVLLFKKKTD